MLVSMKRSNQTGTNDQWIIHITGRIVQGITKQAQPIISPQSQKITNSMSWMTRKRAPIIYRGSKLRLDDREI